MEHVSSFQDGLNKDVSKTLLKPSQYRDARNIRITTEDLDSTAAVTNINGNRFFVKIPQISNVVKLIIFRGFPATILLTINGIVVTGVVNNYQDIANLINNEIQLQPPSTTNPTGLGIIAAASTDYILIWSSITNSITTSVNVSISNLINLVNIPTNISTQTGLKIIGWGLIRDEIILFTTNNDSLNPGGHNPTLPTDPSSLGQIFKLTYDPVSFIPTLSLLYNNFIDLTTNHPFRKEGQVEGRYENSFTKRVYWTDNFNELRKFNIVDPNGFALNPVLLNSKAIVKLDVPILQKINDSGGQVYIGNYQCAYRLKNLTGSKTVFSKCSNIVPITGSLPDSTSFRDYIANAPPPSVSNSGKSITWNIDNVDTNYERIEIAILFRLNRTDQPTITLLIEEPIPINGNYTFTYTGFEQTTPLDLNTFNSVNSTFTHCKTITSKDNLLLAANLRNISFDAEYDARAYRWPYQADPLYDPKITQVEDSQRNPLNVDKTIANTFGVPETHDAINIDQYNQGNGGYRFQDNGVTLGGTGPNISYTFASIPFSGDVVTSLPTFVAPHYFENARYTFQNPASFPLNDNNFNNNNFYDSFKSPYLSSAFKGYHHDEVYAFAIRFYDKSGNPGFAKWIADIRMPLIYESINAAAGFYTQFPTSDRNGFNGTQRIFILIPEFVVNIPVGFEDKISAWEIIRCERTTNDKSIMAAGLLHQLSYKASIDTYFSCTPQDASVFDGGDPYDPSLSSNPATGHIIDPNLGFFRSPEFLFNSYPGISSGDKIKIVAELAHPNGFNVYRADAPSYPNNHRMVKLYDIDQINDPIQGSLLPYMERTLDINGATILLKGTQTNLNGSGTAIRNNTDEPSPQSIGGYGIVLEWFSDDVITFNQLIQNQNSKYYAYYVRSVTLQYGGNTYSQRAGRKYISCGHYQEVSGSGLFPARITGGDIYTTIFETVKQFKSWPLGGDKNACFYHFPVETSINTEWRYGTDMVNRLGFPNAGGPVAGNASNIDLIEEFFHNPAFSAEDNIKLGFPKPVDFQDIEENDNRIRASEFKINGESVDSWGIFPTLDFEDADGRYGPINNLQILNDNIIGLQDKGIFHLPVNEKVTIPDNSTGTLLLGTGDKLSRPNYITTESGCKHQFGNIVTERGLYYFDIYNFKLNKLTNHNEELSVIKGLDSYFKTSFTGNIRNTDNTVKPIKAGIACTYDQNNHEVIFTFHDSGIYSTIVAETIAYNELVQAFTSFYDFKPSLYINTKSNILSPNDSLDSLYIHNLGSPGLFYNIYYNSSLSFLVAPQIRESVFDNFQFTSEVSNLAGIPQTDKTWNTIRVFNDYQNSGLKSLINGNTIKREKRMWNLNVPRSAIKGNLSNIDIMEPINLNPSQLFLPRMRGKYIQVDLILENGILITPRKIIMPSWKTIFRPNAR